MPPESADAPCPRCEGRGWVLAPDGSAGTASPCSCRNAREVELRLERAGIPPRYLRKTLQNFNAESPSGADSLWQAKELSLQYVRDFLTSSGGFVETGLLFTGPPGGGKTHLAVGVLRALIERYAVRGRFVDFTDLVYQIQSTFDAGSEESKDQVLSPIIEAEVLVLDELGAQRSTPFVNDMLYLVLNKRYARCLPTIFTTNHPIGEPEQTRDQSPDRPRAHQSSEVIPLTQRIPVRLVSRLYEMARMIELPVKDFRREVQAEHLCV